MSHNRCIRGAAVLAVVLFAYASAAADLPLNEAGRFVKALGDDAVTVLSTEEVGSAQRSARYRELLHRGFAIDIIARFVLGRYWRAASEAQRRAYLGLFREYVLDVYAARLDRFAGETFEILKEQPLDEKDTMVSTEIRTPGDAPIRVDYRVRALADGHKVIDVLVEGVSLITTQRSEFASIINRKGIDGLLELLRERTSPGLATN